MSTDKAIDLPLTVAVTDDHLPVEPFPRRPRSSTILLPKWLYIIDRNGRYLTVVDPAGTFTTTTLTFRTGESDINCVFEAIRIDSLYRFRGNNGHTIMRMSIIVSDGGDTEDCYICPSSSVNTTAFEVITSSGNYVYFKDNFPPGSKVMCDELRQTDLNFFNGAPVARNFINESSMLEIVHAGIKNEIVDINYDIPGGTVREAAPVIALSTAVRNDSDDASVEHTLSYSYEKWTVGTWNNIAGIELGAKSTFKAGVPFVATAEFEISVSASYSHEWGGEEGRREIITSSTAVTLPPRKKARATIIVRNAQIDVGFTYTQKILWSNGESETEEKKGIYENVDSWHVDVVLDNWEDL